jgi:hypothetical protein
MKKVIKLTESDLTRIIKRVISENKKTKVDENIFKRIGQKIEKGLGIDDESANKRRYKHKWESMKNRALDQIGDVLGIEGDEYAAADFRYAAEQLDDQPNMFRVSIFDYVTQKNHEVLYNIDNEEVIPS